MKKAVIFFFSGTGNTWWVSQQLSKRLGENGMETEAVSIERVSPAEVGKLMAGCDIAGFGYPIYGSDLPEPMKDFIAGLEPVNGREAFIFCTQYLYSGDGALAGAHFLRRKGFTVKWGEHFPMPNNVCVTVIPFPFTNNPEKLARKLHGAGRRIKRFAARIAAGKPFRRGFNPVSSLLGSLQRIPFRRAFKRLRNDIGIDPERCRNCGICARLCPSGNLISEGDKIFTRGSCIICLRCYNFCPHQAITYRGRPHKITRGIPYRGPVEGFDPLILRNPGPEKQ